MQQKFHIILSSMLSFHNDRQRSRLWAVAVCVR